MVGLFTSSPSATKPSRMGLNTLSSKPEWPPLSRKPFFAMNIIIFLSFSSSSGVNSILSYLFAERKGVEPSHLKMPFEGNLHRSKPPIVVDGKVKLTYLASCIQDSAEFSYSLFTLNNTALPNLKPFKY